MTPLHCEGASCKHARYVQPDIKEGELETHIVAVEGGRALKGPQWPRIAVDIEPTVRPVRLVLSSRQSVQWDLRGVDESLLKEVHVVTPKASRITGLSDRSEIGLFWHGEEILCVHPYSWWDVDNPNNEYQRFLAALRTLLDMKETSFQGTRWGESFKVPFYKSHRDEAQHVLSFREKWKLNSRQLASVGDEKFYGPVFTLENHALRDRGWGEILPASGEVNVLEPIPEGRIFLDRRHDGQEFLLTDGARLLRYDPKSQTETPLPAPPSLGNFSRLHLAKYHADGENILAYFRDFGGVVHEWNADSGAWKHSFDFYRQEIDQWVWGEKTFWGVTHHKNIVQLLKFDLKGRKIDQRDYLLPWEPGGARTRWTLERHGKGFLLKHFSAAAPQGRWYLLGASGEIQIISY